MSHCCLGAFTDEIGLEFRKNREHPKDHLAGGCRRVDPLGKTNQVCSAPCQAFTNSERVSRGSGESAQAEDNESRLGPAGFIQRG
jgi:hypothetical protein